MQKATRLLEAVFTTTIDAIIVTDSKGIITMFNQAAEQMFGYQSAEVIGLNVSILMPPPDSQHHHLYLERYLETRQPRIPRQGREAIAKRRNGENFFIDISITDVQLDDEILFTAFIRDITARKEREQRIIQLAFFDQETGLPNAYYLREKLEDILKEKQTNYYLISLYLNNLSDYINIFGVHGIKDIITTLNDFLNSHLPEKSFITRCGVRHLKIIYHVQNQDLTIEQIAQQIQEYLASELTVNNHRVFLTVKFGLTKILPKKHTVKTLLDHVDIALHIAKHSIATDYQIFRAEFEKNLNRRALIVQKLYQAITHTPFELYLQPQISLTAKKIVGVEALIRWQDHDGTWLAPSEFIPIAETIGVIKEITLWTLKQAFSLIVNQGKQNFRIAINISAQVLCSHTFVNEITTLMIDTGVDPNVLELEITETALMLSVDIAIQNITDLSALGISFSIDDFGTGLSSLAYLKLFKINKIKIDKSFVTDILNNSRDLTMVDAIIRLGHELGYQIVCEGVENKNQLELLIRLGCDQIQGYYFAKPMPAHVFLNFKENFRFL